MSERPFISQFSPQWTKPELLESILVQRDGLIRESVDLMRESVLTANKHHLLFVGPRGIGKTHLVRLVQHRLAQQASADATLGEKLRFAWLNEDEIATSFLRLLVLLYHSLADRYPAEFSKETIQSLVGRDPETARGMLERAFLEGLGERTAMVIVENLDDLFAAMPVAEQYTWRAFVQNHPVFATLATAQTLFDGVSDREQPFFGFFDTRHLESLSVDEARTLLENLARLHADRAELLEYLGSPQGRARVRAIHELSGGNPRLFVIFSDLFVRKQDLDGLVRPFEEMVDRQLTSFYQERLRWLSPQQREIIQLLSRFGHPVPVKRIADSLFTTHNSITGQLKLLRDMRYVSFKPLGREVLYELAEPLMRLALQVKETNDRRPLALIVDFLRVAFEREEIESRLATCAPESRGRAYLASALAAIDAGEPNPRDAILRHRLQSIPLGPCDDNTLSEAKELAAELNTADAWVRLGFLHNFRREWSPAVLAFTRVLEASDASATDTTMARFERGSALYGCGRIAEALEDYKTVVTVVGLPPELLSRASLIRGMICEIGGRVDEATEDYSRVIGLPEAPVELVATCLVLRGRTHLRLGRLEQAIRDLSRGTELPDVPKEQLPNAFLNRAIAFEKLGRVEEAIADFALVIEHSGAAPEQVASALSSRAICYAEAKMPEAVLRDCSRLATEFDASVLAAIGTSERAPRIAEVVVGAILAHTTDVERWEVRIIEFLGHFARYDGLAQLGDALVRHLPKLAESPLSHAAWDAWVTCWENAWGQVRLGLQEKDQGRLELPLRLLRVGVDYLKERQESRLLLLPSEERSILRRTFGLTEE